MIRHLLVTNDFPPKVGGIQSYLWELWRRLPPADVTVLTTPHQGSRRFDAEQGFEIVRTREPVLFPNPLLLRRVRELAARVGAELVVLDPAVPLEPGDRVDGDPPAHERSVGRRGRRPAAKE